MPILKLPDLTEQLSNGAALIAEETGGNSRMSAHYVEMEPGGEVRPHQHPRTEVYVFLTGRAIVMTGDEITEIATGDVAVAPAGVPHAIKVLGNETLRLYSFNSPPASSCPMADVPEEVLWKWKRVT